MKKENSYLVSQNYNPLERWDCINETEKSIEIRFKNGNRQWYAKQYVINTVQIHEELGDTIAFIKSSY